MRVRISRAINYYLLGGKKNVMVSSRVYVNDNYGWTLCIDWWFYFLRGERNHCRNSFLYDYGGGLETQTEAEQGTNQTSQK